MWTIAPYFALAPRCSGYPLFTSFAQSVHHTSKGNRSLNKSYDPPNWTSRKSAELYGIDEWSSGYFGVSESGEVVVRVPINGGESSISLMEMAQEIGRASCRERVWISVGAEDGERAGV